jgi:FtsZ-interacting cell division protein YlmF
MGTPPVGPESLEETLRTRPAAGRYPGKPSVEIVLLAPSGLEDASVLIAAVRAGRLVLVDASAAGSGVMQRLIDICSGAVMAMDGQVQALADQLYLFAPALAKIEEL